MLNKFLFIFLLFFWFASPAFATNQIVVLEISGAINPAVAEFVSHEIHKANEDQQALIVLNMDTPGGLDTSMRQIIKKIQKPNKKNNKASIIILTHENIEKNFNNLFKNLSKNKFVLKKPTFIRIEKV